MAEPFQAGKSGVGPDHYQVRNCTCRHRQITLAVLVLAILAVIAATTLPAPTHSGGETHMPGPGPIALAVNEIRLLPSALILVRPRPAQHILYW
ncbi:hypothetical protein ACFT8W_17415 [Streptomyces hygroscopicus]|uniref:hypothetical protein n=1 Tax=Streptomyces hygroscopicus TaxID=1912 RepID=UPI003627E3DB